MFRQGGGMGTGGLGRGGYGGLWDAKMSRGMIGLGDAKMSRGIIGLGEAKMSRGIFWLGDSGWLSGQPNLSRAEAFLPPLGSGCDVPTVCRQRW